MWIYEVNLTVDRVIAEAYERFLRPHIQQVIEAGGFDGADWWVRQPEDEASDPSKILWTIHYRIASRDRLDAYLKEKAPQLRAEALQLFGNQFTATRRILRKL